MFPGFNQRQFSNIVAGDTTSNQKQLKQKWETKHGRRCLVPKYHSSKKDFGTFIYITIMLHNCDTNKPVKQFFDVREGYIATRIILSKSSLMRLFPKSENSLSGFPKFQEALHSRIGQCHRRLPRTVTHTRDRFIK